MHKQNSFFCLFLIFSLLISCADYKKPSGDYDYPEPILIAGEPSASTIILHARLNAESEQDSIYKGMEGIGFFEISTDSTFDQFYVTKTYEALPKNGYTLKALTGGLIPDQTYFYRLKFGKDDQTLQYSRVAEFKTLPSPEEPEDFSLVMVTGSHYDRFYLGGDFGRGNNTSQGKAAYSGPDAALGYPAHEAILDLSPDVFIGNGDNVYYDHPPFNKALEVPEMRHKWHQQFMLPRYRKLLDHTTTFWLKDDHDHRYDDSDTLATNEKHGPKPTNEEGKKMFLEQIPLSMPEDSTAKTYRTFKAGSLLQVWMLEGRDYRSPNKMEDGPEKTMWGKEQKEWLKETLLSSTAAFKVLITPTPMIGPDDKRKTDNHTNIGGFRYEGQAFFNWIKENKLDQKGFYIFCGDRHWQYHSISQEGIEEFSSGALVDQNSRLGRLPGDPNSTDPEAKITQPFTSPEASGGFLWAKTFKEANEAKLQIKLYDENGKVLYEVTKVQ